MAEDINILIFSPSVALSELLSQWRDRQMICDTVSDPANLSTQLAVKHYHILLLDIPSLERYENWYGWLRQYGTETPIILLTYPSFQLQKAEKSYKSVLYYISL